jgi:hypothetical protein
MKKILLALVAMASLTAANAQKNTVLVFGAVDFMTSKDETGPASTTNNSFFINPGVGYQFSNKSTIGIQGGYGMTNTINSVSFAGVNFDMESRYSEWQAGAFYRYTCNLNKIFFLFGQVNAAYMSGTTSIDTAGVVAVGKVEDTYNGFGATAFPGVGINVHNGWALNFAVGGIGYQTATWDKATTTSSSFNVTFGQQINFGISKNIGGGCCRKKHKGHIEPGHDMRKASKEVDEDDE